MTEIKKVTIKDIAKSLGVSFSTVAKALNDDSVVAEETRKRVHEKAKEMGYLPNLMAVGLRSNSTRTIGIILNDIENPTRSYIIKRISMEMVKHGFTSFIFDSSYSESIEKQNINNLISRIPDCIIISPVNTNSGNMELLNGLYDRTIILSNIQDKIPANYVHMDHIRGGYISARCMLSNGHRNNLIIMEPLSYPSGSQFYQGIQQAYAEAGVEIDPNLISYGYPSIDAGINAISEKYDEQNKRFKINFTGVIASNDMFAIGIYKAANLLGFNIPDDLSIIGYDDHPIASLLNPQLSTLSYPKEDVAKLCIEILTSRLINNKTEISKFTLEPELVSRNSIKKV
jgi:DNA-binding LacI/PurR family transcriptional regulator